MAGVHYHSSQSQWGYKTKFQLTVTASMKLCLLVLYMCQNQANSQRMDRLSCERRPTHTTALKLPGDNGFSIKILGTPPVEYYEPGKDYQVLLNGSYSNQQFLDFMLVATLKNAGDERQTAGMFTHVLSHMTQEDLYCSHVMTSVTFHPSYKKSVASFLWTAPSRGSGCVLFKATVLEHPDIWYSDDGGLTKMLCEKTEEDSVDHSPPPDSGAPDAGGRVDGAPTSSHTRRQATECCACDVAKYELTFVGNWSRETHPSQFPSREHESLLHWSDIIGASHSPSYSIWSYDTVATTGVKSVCEYGWPSILEGEIKQQSRNVRTVIKASGIWGYPALYTTRRSARFSTDNARPYMSLLTMIGPSPDWCVGVDSVNMCLENCTWLDNLDMDLYPWDAGTDSGVTYLSQNLATYPREKIHPITNRYPNNTASPFYGSQPVRPMATVRIRRVGARNGPANSSKRCEAAGGSGGSTNTLTPGGGEEILSSVGNVKCMVTEWSDFSSCSVTCGVGIKSRSRDFKHPMGSPKMCPNLKLQEMENCLGLVNECEVNPDEPVDFCVTTPWSTWSPCSVSCGSGAKVRLRQYLHPMGPVKCSHTLREDVPCTAEIADCLKARMMIDWANVCKMRYDPGSCMGNFTRFFYDMNMRKCRPFSYTGCRGNQNKFDTEEDCQDSCLAVMAGEEVSVGVDTSNIDCMVTEWTPFSECTVSCGTGLRSRSRSIKIRSSGTGERCPKRLIDTRVCASECSTDEVGSPSADNVDCMLSEWGVWSDCSTSCDEGVQARQRMVKRPAQGQGRPCDSNFKEMRVCDLGSCDAHSQCMLSEWSGWTECSVACGVGKQMKRRMVKRGPCPEDSVLTQTKSCNGTQCQGAAVNCVISGWADWTECNKPCGSMGTQTRFRLILQPAVYGGSCEFEEPKQMEERTCYNGACSAVTRNVDESNAPVDCRVSEWSSWSPCSKTCGTGKQVRRRRMTLRRKNRGERCPPLKQVQPCDTGAQCRGRRYRHL